MKQVKYFLPLLLMGGFLLQSSVSAFKLKYPKKVNEVIQAKCYGCHNPAGQNEKAKSALNWDNLLTMDAMEQGKKVKAIAGTLDQGTMPPKMFLERMPDKKLTADEAKILSTWANKAAKKLMK